MKYHSLHLLKFIIILSNFAIQYIESQSNCMPITAWNYFGSKLDNGDCFEVLIYDLDQMIIHTQINIIGFIFNFKNGSTQSYNENSDIMNKSLIDLKNITMTGVDVYVGEGIEALKLQLYDSLTLRYCLSNTVYYFYSLKIRTVKYRFYTNY